MGESESKAASSRSTPKAWPRAPEHRLSECGTYIVTVGTLGKRHFFRDKEALKALHDGLLKYAAKYGWRLEAWAVFSNHYHFVGHSPEGDGVGELARFLSHLHSRSAAWLNRRDGESGRKVWHNYWETRLTHQRSYLARLNYVHQNPARHGLVAVANQYPWCSARWFERTATNPRRKTIYGLKTDRVNVLDDYTPIWSAES